MNHFEAAFNRLILIEGGYSNDPADSGGRTMYGITERVARRNGYKGNMASLPLEVAQQIYRAQYWDTLALDAVAARSRPSVAEELFDTAVNCGVAVAGTFLQRCLNALNRQEQYYSDIVADGLIGPATLGALSAYVSRRGIDQGVLVLLRMLNALQGERYIALAEKREKDEEFIYGWFLHRVKIEEGN